MTVKEEEDGSRRKGQLDDYLPERKKYEQLCRGEGLGMVRRQKRTHIHLLVISSVTWLLSAARLLAGRAASSAVTMTTIVTPNT